MKLWNNFKKMTALVLALLMCLTFGACGDSKAPDDTSVDETMTAPATTADTVNTTPISKFATPGQQKYSETVTVTTIKELDPSTITFADGEDIENNIWTRAALEEYGIQIKYKWVAPSAQYAEKIALMLSTGDMPDFFPLDAVGFKQATKSNLLADLTEVYNTTASEATKERMNLDGGDALKAGTIDNKLYGIVQANSWKTDSIQQLWIRNDWLKKLNLSVPKTVDQLIEVATAFAKNDPDGNNKDDTLGLGMQSFLDYNGLLCGMNAYRDIWYPDSSGKLVYGSVQPEMKAALLKVKEMYANGLLDKEFYLKTYDNYKQDITTGKIGMMFDNYIAPLHCMDNWDADKNADWQPYPLPALTEADYPAKSTVMNGFTYYLVVNKDCKNPEALIKLINLFVDKQSNDGDYITDKDGRAVWNYAPANISTPDNNLVNQRLIAEALKKKSPDGLPTQAVQNYNNVINLQNGSTDKTDWGLAKIFGDPSSLTVLDQNYILPKHYIQDYWYGAPTPTMVKSWASLVDLQKQAFTNIVLGASIDEFDTFVKNWYKMGGEQIVAEVNEEYAAR